MLLFLHYPEYDAIRIVSTPYPKQWLKNVIPTSHSRFEVIALHPVTEWVTVDVRRKFMSIKTPSGMDFYRATPELWEYARSVPPAPPGEPGTGRPPAYSDEVVLAVFRDWHEGRLTGRTIARKHGVSPMLVSMIARGATRKHLFRVVADPNDPAAFTVSEARDGAPAYPMRDGRRRAAEAGPPLLPDGRGRGGRAGGSDGG